MTGRQPVSSLGRPQGFASQLAWLHGVAPVTFVQVGSQTTEFAIYVHPPADRWLSSLTQLLWALFACFLCELILEESRRLAQAVNIGPQGGPGSGRKVPGPMSRSCEGFKPVRHTAGAAVVPFHGICGRAESGMRRHRGEQLWAVEESRTRGMGNMKARGRLWLHCRLLSVFKRTWLAPACHGVLINSHNVSVTTCLRLPRPSFERRHAGFYFCQYAEYSGSSMPTDQSIESGATKVSVNASVETDGEVTS